MKRLIAATLLLSACIALAQPAADPPKTKLLLAFASYRDRPKHPSIFFYEHDGVSQGKVIGSVPAPRTAATACGHPALSHDGRFCAFTFEVENQTGRIQWFDIKEQKLIDLPVINDTPNAQMGPSLSADGNLIAFTAWNRPKATGQGWNVFLYDVAGKKLLDLPDLNTEKYDDRMPALSGDGRFIAFTSNRKGGVGLTDVYLYDRRASKLAALPDMNSKQSDVEPSLSADGNLVAFASDRPGGKGGRDIYLYDRAAAKLLPLPRLNSEAHEQLPSLSPDGRFIAFVSERIGGEGERDLYLYDRQTQKLLATPGLNSKTEDFDPCLMVLKGE